MEKTRLLLDESMKNGIIMSFIFDERQETALSVFL
jgi:hypothetical protein